MKDRDCSCPYTFIELHRLLHRISSINAGLFSGGEIVRSPVAEWLKLPFMWVGSAAVSCSDNCQCSEGQRKRCPRASHCTKRSVSNLDEGKVP
mmetsp:Transcript_25364/g.49183  ORF Transcript_25364/g.49183 Transcript_25364/m.49183 type:complete len:93 (-) Transcript_25364:21-299(-)